MQESNETLISNSSSDNGLNFSAPQQESDDFEAEVGRALFAYGIPPILILGTIGNSLAFIVMRRGSLKEISTCFYMAVLAIADTGYLWISGLTYWLMYLTRFEVRLDVLMYCKSAYFLAFSCGHFASAILTIMSVEKWFSVYFPFRAKSLCTVGLAKKVSIVTAIIFVVFNFQFFFTVERMEQNGFQYCGYVNPSYQIVYQRIDSVLYSYGPFTIMILANSAIVYKLAVGRRKSTLNTSSTQVVDKAAKSVTIMLIIVSLTFIILTGPIALTLAVDEIPPPIIYGAVAVIHYVNNGINGFLYCVIGSKFRSEILKCLKCGNTNKIQASTAGESRRSRSPLMGLEQRTLTVSGFSDNTTNPQSLLSSA